jgi:hypothetical protein
MQARAVSFGEIDLSVLSGFHMRWAKWGEE